MEGGRRQALTIARPPQIASGFAAMRRAALGRTAIRTAAVRARAFRRKPLTSRGVPPGPRLLLYREEDFAERVGEITKGEKCHAVMTASARRHFRPRSTA
jgi:hypothetical protein